MSNHKLLLEKYPNKDLFISDIFDNLPFKDDMASMEHPIFSLSTKKDLRVIRYEHNGYSIVISPNTNHGLPTIFDKDILLYCGSLIVNEFNRGYSPSQTIRISPHDLLVSTNRATNGDGYRLFKNALDRLTSVFIETNIETGSKKMSKGFHLLENYQIVESSRVKKRMVKLEITLSDWFYNALKAREVLTINKQYFRLRQPLERRIYEIARKHCGNQKQFLISLGLLHKKSGSSGNLNRFRFNLKKIIEKNVFPDYSIEFKNKDEVIFFKKEADLDAGKENSKTLKKSPSEPDLFLKSTTLEKARDLALKAGTGWDIYAIEDDFKEFNKNNFEISNVDAYFIGFVKKKIQKAP